jgi:hypothetical protein
VSAYEIKSVRIAATADGANALVPAKANRQIRVYGITLQTSGAGTITLEDSDGTDWLPLTFAAAAAPVTLGYGATFLFETAVGKGLSVNNPVGVDTTGLVTYSEV